MGPADAKAGAAKHRERDTISDTGHGVDVETHEKNSRANKKAQNCFPHGHTEIQEPRASNKAKRREAAQTPGGCWMACLQCSTHLMEHHNDAKEKPVHLRSLSGVGVNDSILENI